MGQPLSSSVEPDSIVSMAPAALPELPAEVLDCIACAVLAAEDSDLLAWTRLRGVCRSWRHSLRGARPPPTPAVFVARADK